MKVNVYGIDGKIKDKIELPPVFNLDIRPDIIKRAVLAIQSQKRQPYGTDPKAGQKSSAHYHGKRRMRHQMINRDIARLPRLHRTSPHLYFRARLVPQAVKGRRAHPPKVEKVYGEKINKKELMLAIKSAIAATAEIQYVKSRGHKINGLKELPLIFEDKLQKITKTKDFENLLKSIGLGEEIERCKDRSERAGKGKMRGRKYKIKKGPLVIVAKDEGIFKAASNIPGVDINLVDNISIENLAPGTQAGRLTIWSRSAIEKLRELAVWVNNKKI